MKIKWRWELLGGAGLLVLGCSMGRGAEPASAGHGPETWPGARWEVRAPASLGLAPDALAALSRHVGGRGCVIRHGAMAYSWGDQAASSDVASAFKPLLSVLLLLAVQEGRLPGVDARVAEVEPRLLDLNQGKDAAITWRHLAMQISGYGLTERPGAAYSYNDYALTFYFDTLMGRVFRTNATEVLHTRLAGPLQFEDPYTFNAFGPNNRPGRLALSCRDFARFGLLVLRGGRWRDRALVRPDLLRLAVSSPLPGDFPRTGGQEAPMLPGQRTMGGKRNITPVGPGYYSFNWWLNGTNAAGQRLFPPAPPDAFAASGHGGKRVLFLLPSLDLIVCWNDSPIEDHDTSPGQPATRMNQAVRRILDCVAR